MEILISGETIIYSFIYFFRSSQLRFRECGSYRIEGANSFTPTRYSVKQIPPSALPSSIFFFSVDSEKLFAF